eukprot:COSAG01_NODE_7541_length_3158_cov_22.404707_1_plen_217_part_10
MGPICHVDTYAKRHTHVALNTFLGRIPKPGTTVETSKLLTKGNGVLSRVLMPKRGSAAPATGASERWWAPRSDVITPPQPISAAVAAASAVKWLHTVRRRRCSRLLAVIMGVLWAVVADIVVSAHHSRVQDSVVALDCPALGLSRAAGRRAETLALARRRSISQNRANPPPRQISQSMEQSARQPAGMQSWIRDLIDLKTQISVLQNCMHAASQQPC